MTAKRTLTQRRSKSHPSSQIKPEEISRIQPQSRGPLEHMSNIESDSGSVAKIIIWAIIILVTGVGLAMLVRNITSKEQMPNENTTKTDTSNNTILLDDNTDEGISLDIPNKEDTDTNNLDDNTTGLDETSDSTTEDTDNPDDSNTTPPTGTNLENDYSQKDQYITDGLTEDTVSITGYSYANYSANFVYKIKLAQTNKFPNVTASLNKTEKTLIVTVKNVTKDYIVGNGGTGHTDFNGADNTPSVDITNSNHQTVFTFNLNEIKDYRIYAESGDPQFIVVEIKN